MKILHKIDNALYKSVLIFLGLLGVSAIVLVKVLSHGGQGQDNLLFIYTVAITTFQLSRVLAAILYNRTKGKVVYRSQKHDNSYEPTVSFVVPCMNEEEAIAKTVTACFAADYPKEKVEVIVINDGSTDGTGAQLEKLQLKYPNLIVVNWVTNRGKRHGMAEGFRLAKGEIIIQLDSDSYIDPKSFRNIVVPFSHPEIGAVCAHADPENADKNLLTKMQAAYYFVSFRILKAAESTFSTVFCCSGCSSAYRKSVVLPVLDDWLAEKFLGLPVTWGDDRAITNRVIKAGFRTIYTDEVQAYTICPDTVGKFLKQQIRWKKGWFVNSLFASGFILKKEPFVALTYFFPLIIITLITPFMAVRALIYNPIVRHVAPWYYMLGVFLVAFVMTVYYRFVARENKYWPYVFVWSANNMLFLSFILFVALASIQNRKWGTR